MKHVYLVINWTFGVLFLIIGLLGLLGVFLTNDLSIALWCLPLIAISFLILPPVRKFAYSKTNKEMPFKARAGAVLILFVIFLASMAHEGDKLKKQELAQQAEEIAQASENKKKQIAKEFDENQESILSNAKQLFDQENYPSVIALSWKYASVHNQQLDEFGQKAQRIEAEIEAKKQTEKLLSELPNIRDDDYEKLLSYFQKLAQLNPSNNQQYQEKVETYTKLVKEKQALVKEKQATEKEKKLAKERMEKLKEDPEALSRARFVCRQTLVDSAKYGAKADWGLKGEAYVESDNSIVVVGKDVKIKNAFNTEYYPTYRGKYFINSGKCVIMSAD